MTPRIESLQPKKLIGKSVRMSLYDNKSGLLWTDFIPRLKEIDNRISNNRFSLQVYEPHHFENFNPARQFEKWALIEVANFDNVPAGFETFDLTGGLYTVFTHKGDTKEFQKTAQYIYGVWLPNSEYNLDNRPHFEILGEKTKRDDPNSEEEVWIPIKQ